MRDLFPRDEIGPVYTPKNRGRIRLSAGEILELLRYELIGLHVCASHMAQGRFDPDIKELLEASTRRISIVLAEVEQ
jgi:hypothetical protein